jgi:hypothetical protein
MMPQVATMLQVSLADAIKQQPAGLPNTPRPALLDIKMQLLPEPLTTNPGCLMTKLTTPT